MKAFFVAIASRLCVIAWVVAVSFFVEPYDSSQDVGGTGASRSDADAFVTGRLSRLTNWDGVFFTHLSVAGYEYEQFHAFFPLLPIALRVARYAWNGVRARCCH